MFLAHGHIDYTILEQVVPQRQFVGALASVDYLGGADGVGVLASVFTGTATLSVYLAAGAGSSAVVVSAINYLGALVGAMGFDGELRRHDMTGFFLIFVKNVKDIKAFAFVVAFTATFARFVHLVFADVLVAVLLQVAVAHLSYAIVIELVFGVDVANLALCGARLADATVFLVPVNRDAMHVAAVGSPALVFRVLPEFTLEGALISSGAQIAVARSGDAVTLAEGSSLNVLLVQEATTVGIGVAVFVAFL